MAEKEGLGLVEDVARAVLKIINFEKIQKKVHQIDVDIGRLRENIYYIRDDINKIKDRREKKIIEMFKEIKEVMEKPKSEYQFFAQVLSFLIHSLAGKPTMQDLNIADPTIEQVKEWSDKLIEANADMVKDSPIVANRILNELLKDMQKYLKEMKK